MIKKRKNRGREKAFFRNLIWLWAHALFVSITVIALSTRSIHTLAADLVELGNATQSPLEASTNEDIVRALKLLRMQVEESRTTRVIVGLRVVFAPDGELAAAAVALQRKEIADMQSVVLEKIPTLKQRPEAVKTFDTIPFMALEINAAELETLVSLAEIVSIEADQLVAPVFGIEAIVPEGK